MNPETVKAFPGVWGSIGLLLALFGTDLLISMLLTRLGLVTADARLEGIVAGTIASNLLVVGIYLRRRGLGVGQMLHPAAYSPRAGMVLLAGPILLLSPAVFLAGGVIDDALVALVPVPDWQRRIFESLFDGSWASFVLLVVVAPIFEEILFRGIILRGLLTRMRPGWAIAVSSLIFGAAHLNLYQFVGAGLLGLALGWMYVRLRSTLPCMLLHAVQNALVFAAVGWLGIDASTSDVPAPLWVAAAAAAVPGALLLRRVLKAAGAPPPVRESSA